MDAVAIYHEALARAALETRETALAGFYNRNVRVDDPELGPVLVRIPGADAEAMDVTLWTEPEVLEAVCPHVPLAPRLLHVHADPPFQIHEFIAGRRVDDVAPDGKPMPDTVLDGVERFFRSVLRVPRPVLPPVPEGWPADGDARAFAARLLGFVREVRDRGDAAAQGLYSALGVPADPCAALAERAERELGSRPFRLLHADIHRKNMILTDRGRVVFLDWELALWGDPVYDLADHLHKTAYTAADRQRVVEGWERVAPQECLAGWRTALEFYAAYEEMKSAVVDTVRWGRRIGEASTTRERARLGEELRVKLAAAAPHWGGVRVPDGDEVEGAARYWFG
ncbi:phosphotransferase [Yinghuangia seranimata]|uniref:phosphotransferase n=1 Tax=Yinghuangia seranimata TaxID=408067 RepID=UPI00248C27FF|nr:phosphotransferase [Yinghuangia seranimata]MDI2130892.1 phosphotransferase [Yinghuangia seranimata]